LIRDGEIEVGLKVVDIEVKTRWFDEAKGSERAK
jgi:hypothetical protein